MLHLYSFVPAVWLRGLITLFVFYFSCGAYAQSIYRESQGLVVIEMEHASSLNGWELSNSIAGATGDGYILYTESQQFNQTGVGELRYRVEISTPGTYRFEWRVAVANGNDGTEHNDSWLKIDAPVYFAKKNDSQLKPKPDCNTDPAYGCPNGSSLNGFFKIYGGGINAFTWQAVTSDNDGHPVFATFDQPGVYDIRVHARSTYHAIDRLVLYHEDVTTATARDLSNPESPVTGGSVAGCGGNTPFQILHFTKTNGFDHQTRDESAQLFTELGQAENFTVVDSESATVFDDLATLLTYEAVVFSNTSGNNLLNATQRANLEAYIAAGGSFLGLHAATDTYRNQSWPFYNQLVGGIVQTNPNHTSQNYIGTMDHIGDHPSTANLPDPWEKQEEYYYWELNGGQLSSEINETLRVRATGGNSYDAPRPMAWYQEFPSGARSYYTALGHAASNYTDPGNDFRQLLRDALCWCVLSEGDGGGGTGSLEITGELRTWHRIALNFTGPNTSETATPNPFSDYRLSVTFTQGDKSYTVPGFYAADGDAAETSAETGDQWRVYFAPDSPGEWNYSVSFTTGPDVAIDGGGTSAGFMDGITGSFTVAPTDKTGRDHRGKGRLEYVGEHYLRFAGTGEWFVKAGADAPENTLAYEDFDAVPNKGNRRKSWAPHAQDYDSAEAEPYTWQEGKGSELLGVVRYLSEKGVNALSFLTFSLQGDDKNVFPHRLTGTVGDFESTNANWNQSVFRDRFDISRLDQWERIFAYADQKGVFLHFKLQETENDQLMDGGDVGRERKLYYRELIARFAHHLALNWNMGEENTQSTAQRRAMAQFFADNDPYGHLRVIHTYPGQKDAVYGPLLGADSEYTGASLQTSNPAYSELYGDVADWVGNSAEAEKKWVVAVDEPGSANIGVDSDPDDRKLVRHRVVWATFMAGGAGTEFYYGYQSGCGDLDCEDHRSRDEKYTDAAHALHFFQTHFQAYLPAVVNDNGLTAVGSDYVLAAPGQAYAVYLPDGGSTAISLPAGQWQVQWYNPRDGSMGSPIVLGENSLAAPDDSNDWTALILPTECTAGNPCDDGDPCTVDDTLDENCNCAGTTADSDDDGVCDAEDQCPGQDDTLDGDNDGIPDACDDCDGNLAGTTCDDGDPLTTDDRFNADCVCVGQPPAGTNEYWLEAECADFGDEWAVVDDPTASEQTHLRSLTADPAFAEPAAGPAQRIRFTVDLATAGTYVIFARTTGTNDGDDSFWVRVDDGPWIAWNKINFPYTQTGWVWEQVAEWTGGDSVDPQTFDLDAGPHTIDFAHREPDTQLDKLLITPSATAPTGIGASAQNCDPDCTPGTICDDGNACTENDTLDEDCNCVGEVVDSDGDGVCDAEDQCPGQDDTLDADNDGIPDGCDDCEGTPGLACDDGNACTENDTLDEDCNCVGEVVDSDGDGVCDAEDQCPGQDDTLDADNDGIPDGCDDCEGTPGLACDDGNACTENDTLDENCNCVGEVVDSDGDGVCDAEDQCPGQDDTLDADSDGIPDACDPCDNRLLGTSCDDGDPATVADVFQSDCSCLGQAPAGEDQYWLEAECASLGEQWAIEADPRASLAELVASPQQALSFEDAAPTDAAFTIRFAVDMPVEGTYDIFARVIAVADEGDSFWVRVNGGSWINWNKINYPYTVSNPVWRQVGSWTGGDTAIPVSFFFSAGTNVVEFAFQEPGVALDKILVARQTPMPSGFGAAAIECSATDASDLQVGPLGQLYPNPTRGAVLLTELPAPASELLLTDVWGQPVRRFPEQLTTQRTLELGGLPPGVYFLRARVGKQVGVWRIVLQ